jgi:predicted phosphodiesterase
MFSKHKKHTRRSNPLLGLFRLLLSLIIFAVLVGGAYSAYKQFSGVDPLKLSPQAIVGLFTKEKALDSFFGLLSLDFKKYIPGNSGESAEEDSIKGIESDEDESQSQAPTPPKKQALFKFTLIADSHNSNPLLHKALLQNSKDSKFIIGLGDYTDIGTITELESAKKELDSNGLRYFVIPGDHDLWDSRDKQKGPLFNYTQVFGKSYQSFDYQGVKFILLDNSDDYSGVSGTQLDWLKKELDDKNQIWKAKLVFVHTPIYHPSSAHTMGWVTPELKTQAKNLKTVLKNGGVAEVFSGDIHFFSRYSDPDTNLSMTTVGAVTEQRNVQLPRFAIATVYTDGSLDVDDIEIK